MAQVFITIGNDTTVGNGADGDGDADLHDLARWLADEPALRGRVRTCRGGPPAAGSMGTVSDLLIAVLEPGGAATVLVGTVVTWLRGRRERRTVTIRLTDGTEVTVSSDRVGRLGPEELAAMVRAVAEAVEPDGTRPSGAPEGPAVPDGPPAGADPGDDRARRDRAEEP
ncbi:hypothetical protein [Kitasatospora sp. NPDC056184]|uniref:effector-associated constant component EACC1 n=1 Tax=Kitasatospora sp. NPDC056184 TaxID=3345738 RepID=UPI0035E3223E